MPIHLTNTLSGVKEPLAIPKGRALNMFVCGPTVYDEIHVGNARTYAVFDTLAKYLRSNGVKLFYLENITDIDDKIIARSREEGVAAKEIAARYTKSFRVSSRQLRLTAVNRYAPATRYMKAIITQVRTLIARGHAYEIPGDGWYFDLTTFPDYGKLAKRTVEQAEDGTSRIDENPGKRNRGDFCLWKFSPPAGERGEPAWSFETGKYLGTPNGRPAILRQLADSAGRPGWHIEDTAITEKHFGPQYDLHGGGRDLIFPHHEAEIAQQESASGKKPFVKLWLHVGLVTVDGKKMSKSLGNFTTVKDFLKTHDANTFRLLVARHHYRSPIDFTDSLISETKIMLATLCEFLAKLSLMKNKEKPGIGINIARYEQIFEEAMDDDLNTGAAIAALFTCMNEVNTAIWSLSQREARSIEQWLLEKFRILGVVLAAPKSPMIIRGMARLRERLRSNQQFIKGDALRKKVEALGYRIEDTPVGPLVLPSQKPNGKS